MEKYTLKITTQVIRGRRMKVYEVYDTVAHMWVAQYTYRPAARKEVKRRNEEAAMLAQGQGASSDSRTEASA